ncbi:hypothetical protein KC887_00290 [Candidatus Kaiserbacteria bacterium]|nr:hypothetical protein [Candidatus Kaiserbacteria bacterium]
MTVDIPAVLSGMDHEIAEPLDGEKIVVTRTPCSVSFDIGTGVESNSLAAPSRAGLQVTITCRSTGGGSRSISAHAGHTIDKTGDDTMNFDAARETISLVSIRTGSETFQWQIVANDGVDLA